MRKIIDIEQGAKVILLLILFGQLFFINGLYLFLSLVCLYVILYHLQQPYKSSVFTLLFLYHFMQIIAGIWLSTYLGKDIDFRQQNMGTATILSIIGVVILFIPVIYYQNKMPAVTLDTLKKHADRLSIDKSFYIYLIAFLLAGALGRMRFIYGGYAQIIITLINVKWFFFLLFGFQSILKRKRRKEFYFFIIFEIIIGFASFFSDFKTVIFYVVVLYLVLLVSVTTKRLIITLIFSLIMFGSLLFWTTVKMEYRTFLNKGSKSQSVQVSRNEALTKLYELSNKQNTDYKSSTSILLERLQATKNFALTISRVPAVIPFQDGKNWTESLEFVLTPRLLNPNKPSMDFSKKVTKYTGIQHAGLAQGTSFSLGYFTDSYVDFGFYGMMVILFIIGLFYGKMHLYFIKNSSQNFVFNYSVAAAVFMEFFALEMDNTFLIGRLFASLLTFFLLTKFFFPWLIGYLTVRKTK